MTRYSTEHNIKSRSDGKKFFGTRLYPNIPPNDSDILYITDETDFLDTLAFKFYKDATMWWIIALTNNLGNGRMSIPVGTQLRIPTRVESILEEYNKINS